MLGPYTQDTIENWVSEFLESVSAQTFSPALRDAGPTILTTLLVSACRRRSVEPGELEEADLREALLEQVSGLSLAESLHANSPDLCAALLGWLEESGRLAGGHLLGAYVRALRPAYLERAAGKSRPITRPGSRIGRNDPCPCGSGLKYKKCCQKG